MSSKEELQKDTDKLIRRIKRLVLIIEKLQNKLRKLLKEPIAKYKLENK